MDEIKPDWRSETSAEKFTGSLQHSSFKVECRPYGHLNKEITLQKEFNSPLARVIYGHSKTAPLERTLIEQ